MRFQSYFNTAINLIKLYDGKLPLAIFLKQYFTVHKKHGSKDRKFISHLCYCYYRLGHALNNVSAEEKLKTALFLCNESVGDWQFLFEESWLQNWSPQLPQRLQFTQQMIPAFSVENIFPWQNDLSQNIDAASFSVGHLTQPFLYVRIRPGHEKSVIQRLRDYEIAFKKIAENTLSFANGTKLESILDINKEVVIQDVTSQSIATFITPELLQLNWNSKWKVWDCCVASGGKTILLQDIHPNNQLFLTDVRQTMLFQLQQRLQAARINNWKFEAADLTKEKSTLKHDSLYDFITADVPCTGSGTWSRTPEQIQFFNPEIIKDFSEKQKKIVSNIIPQLKSNGYLLYITCSAFVKENEEVVKYIKENFHLQLIKMEVLKGYENTADTMFAALFKNVVG